MAEIGTGAGSSYPSALDTNNTLEYDKESSEKTLVRADVVNDMASAIVNIEAELGTDPAGTKADVKTFLQVDHATNGGHKKVGEIRIVDGTAFTTIQAAIDDLPT